MSSQRVQRRTSRGEKMSGELSKCACVCVCMYSCIHLVMVCAFLNGFSSRYKQMVNIANLSYNKDHILARLHERRLSDSFGLLIFLTLSNASKDKNLRGTEHLKENWLRQFVKSYNRNTSQMVPCRLYHVYSSNCITREFGGYIIQSSGLLWVLKSSTVFGFQTWGEANNNSTRGPRASDRIICDSTKSVIWTYTQPCHGVFCSSSNTHRHCWFEYRQRSTEIFHRQTLCTWLKLRMNSFSSPSFYLACSSNINAHCSSSLDLCNSVGGDVISFNWK